VDGEGDLYNSCGALWQSLSRCRGLRILHGGRGARRTAGEGAGATVESGGNLKVLLLENISGVAASQFEEAGFEVESLKGAMDEAELMKKIRGVAILGARSKTRVTAAVLEAAPDLVSVGAFCIGVDKIDRAAASDSGIAVFNDPHSNSRSVAELAMGEIILLMRRTFEASTKLHGGV